MKSIVYLSFFLICYFTYGFFLSQFEVNYISHRLRSNEAKMFYDYRGIINIHTNQSIGSANHSFIINSAKQAGMDFIMFTDLNPIDSKASFEGYNGNLLSLVGGKFSFLDSRIINYSKNISTIGSTLGEIQVRLTDYLSQKAQNNKDQLLILAHPFKTGFSWNGEYPAGIDGFEFLNLKTMSLRAWEDSKLSTFWSIFIYPFNQKLAFSRLFKEPTEEGELLDKLSLQRPIYAYAGAEASARAIPLANYLIRFPSYQKTFEIMSNHILLKSELTGNFKIDKGKIYDALKKGNFYLAMDILGNPEGFVTYIEDHGKIHMVGSELKFERGQVLKVKLGALPIIPYEVIIYKNGEKIIARSEPEFGFPLTESGVYRIQVRLIPLLPLPDAKKWLTWIYSNPFFVR